MLVRVLVAVAVLVGVSQALLPGLKRAEEQAFKRYVHETKEKMAEGAKRQWNEYYECPLYECYFMPTLYGDEEGSGDYSGTSCSQTGDCMREKLEAGNVCNCSLNDIIWAQREASSAETCDQLEDYNDDCYECYSTLPDNIWNPDDLAFSCDRSKVDDAERCFSKMKDASCLNDLMAGYEVQPKFFFEAVRQEIDGCPLSSIVWNCVDNSQGFYGDYTACALSYGGLAKTKACVKEMTTNIPTCNVADDMQQAMEQALDDLVITFCAPIESAVSMKGACCEAEAKKREEEEKRGTKYHTFHPAKKGTKKFHKFHKASVIKKILTDAGLI